jgi:hypothetical protein
VCSSKVVFKTFLSFVSHVLSRRLEAELEKLQNTNSSGDSMLFSTPCWSMTSPWDHNGTALYSLDVLPLSFGIFLLFSPMLLLLFSPFDPGLRLWKTG